jgi:citrate synthase
MTKSAKLFYHGREFDIPIFAGSENEMALDISSLRAQTGLVTLDEGFAYKKNCGPPLHQAG